MKTAIAGKIKKDLAAPFAGERGHLLAAMAIAGFNFIFQLGGRSLWSGGEARAAEIAKEMIERGDYFLPHLNGEVVLTKPPLFHWLIIASSRITGFNELAVRLPAALSALGSVLFTYLLGKELFGKRAGLGAALILASSVDFIWNARSAKIDNLVVLTSCAALYFFYRGYKYPAGRRDLNFAISYLAMGLGALAKGPFGFAPAVVIIAVFLAASKKWRAFGQFFRFKFIVVFLAVALPWYAYVFFQLGGFAFAYNYFFGQELILYLGVSNLSPEPTWWYLPKIMIGFLPWSLFFPVALALAARELWRNRQEGFLLTILWFALLLLIFSSGDKKAERYILPIYPALALITSQLFHWEADENPLPWARRFISISFWALVALQIVVTAILLFGSPIFEWLTSPGFSHQLTETDLFAMGYLKEFFKANYLFLAFISLVMLALIVLAHIFMAKSRWTASLAAVVAAITIFNLVYNVKVIPLEDSFRSPKPFAQLLNRTVPPGATLVAYPAVMDQMRFYVGRHVNTERDAARFADILASKEEVYAIIFEKDLKKIKKTIDGKYFLRDNSYRMSFRRIYLISNRPPQ